MENGRLFFAATGVLVLGCWVFTRLRRPPPDQQANETVNCPQHQDNSNIRATSSRSSIFSNPRSVPTNVMLCESPGRGEDVKECAVRKTSPSEDQTSETPDDVSQDTTIEIIEAQECEHKQVLTPACKKNDENFQTEGQAKVTVLEVHSYGTLPSAFQTEDQAKLSVPEVSHSYGTLPSAKESTHNEVYDVEDGKLPNILPIEYRKSAPQLGIAVKEMPKLRNADSLPSRDYPSGRARGKQKYTNWKPEGVMPGFKPYRPQKLIASKNTGSSRKKVAAPVKLRRKYQRRRNSEQAAEEPRESEWRPYNSRINGTPA